MNIWLAVALILAVISLYLFMIEIFSVAFKLTGLATSKIKFQVASLFTGTGFTTTESELITNDERRRKIAVACTYTGHIFSVIIMGLVINVIFSISNLSGSSGESINWTEWFFIVFYISTFVFLLMIFLKIPPINKRFQRFLESIAVKSSKRSRNTNIITVLDMYGKHAIAEIVLNKIPDSLNEAPLFQMQLTKKYSINVLSIRRGNRIVDITKDTMFVKGDMLVIYGLINDIKEVFINSLKDKQKAIVINNTNELNLINNYGAHALMEIEVNEVPKELENIKMKDSHLTDRYGINIVVIRRKDEYLSADKETIILEGDRITLFGPYLNIKHLFNNDNK